jgi:succinyl-CoA synthetase alpha subunit
MIFSAMGQVLVQGITEPLGLRAVPAMQAYGSRIVAGVAPGNGGQVVAGVPVYDMVEQVVAAFGPIAVSVIFSHPYEVLDAALEAIRAGVRQLILVTQGIPPLDMIRLIRQAEATDTLVVGPNTPGVIVPGQLLLGVHPTGFYRPGSVGLLSRNGPLTYEIAQAMSQADLGQSIALSIGSDAILGSTLPQWLQMLEEDEQTEAIVLIGEIGGDAEELAAHYVAEAIDKPVVAYIAGYTAPRNRRLGHAGAILESRVLDLGPDLGTAESKIAALKRAGIPVATRPSDVPKLLRKVLRVTGRRIA